MIEHVVFDLDGTLIDSAPSILASFAATLAAHGIEPAANLDQSIIGPPLRDTLARLTGKSEPAFLESLSATFKLDYDTVGYKATVVFPGVRDMLDDLADRAVPVYVATNKRLSSTRLILENLGWSEMFWRVYALDCVEPPFSHKAELLAKVVRDIGLDPRRVAYVGDKYEDGVAAEKNLLPFFAACWGYGSWSNGEIKQKWQELHQPRDLMAALSSD